jgi:hypothetical protein
MEGQMPYQQFDQEHSYTRRLVASSGSELWVLCVDKVWFCISKMELGHYTVSHSRRCGRYDALCGRRIDSMHSQRKTRLNMQNSVWLSKYMREIPDHGNPVEGLMAMLRSIKVISSFQQKAD